MNLEDELIEENLFNDSGEEEFATAVYTLGGISILGASSLIGACINEGLNYFTGHMNSAPTPLRIGIDSLLGPTILGVATKIISDYKNRR